MDVSFEESTLGHVVSVDAPPEHGAPHIPSKKLITFVLPIELSDRKQEVFAADKPRMSISGWFHADLPPEYHELATLNQLESKKEDAALPFAPLPAAPDSLTPEDLETLGHFMNPTYLDPATMDQVAAQFYSENSIQLVRFLKPAVAERLMEACGAADEAHGLGFGKVPGYQAGVGSGWDLIGPSHKQRYLAFSGAQGQEGVGPLMQQIKEDLFGSRAFAAWLAKVCRLEVKAGRGVTRRFRPGLDYTIAHFGAINRETRLDATLCLVRARLHVVVVVRSECMKETFFVFLSTDDLSLERYILYASIACSTVGGLAREQEGRLGGGRVRWLRVLHHGRGGGR